MLYLLSDAGTRLSNSRFHCPAIFSIRNRRTSIRPCRPISLRISSCSIRYEIFPASSSIFPSSTSKPSFPSSIISLGPQGHVNETGGTPHAIASMMTIPNPSKRDDRANMELSQYLLTMSGTVGSRIQLSVIPSESICC